MVYYTRFNTPFCEIILAGNEEGLSHLHLNTGLGKRQFVLSVDWVRDDLFFQEVKNQIDNYFLGKRQTFSVKLNPAGTPFQKRVWTELSKIPFGALCSYMDIAVKIENPKAARAVGTANGKNPIPLIVPCHRVIGSGGQLVGFAHGVEIKQRMIQFEQDILDKR